MDTHWTLFNSPWNPFEKGTYAHSYKLKAKKNGHLWMYNWSVPNQYSTIVDTDFKTYIIEYKCKQAYMDFYTKEFIDIYTRDGTISDELLKTLKGKIDGWMPKFDIGSKLEPVKTKNCELEKAWGFI